MTREITVIKKEDISGEIVADYQEVETKTNRLERAQLVDMIAELTTTLALYEKLLIDIDAKELSITPI